MRRTSLGTTGACNRENRPGTVFGLDKRITAPGDLECNAYYRFHRMIASQTSDIFSPSSGPVPRRTSGLQVTPVTSETPLRRLECHQGVCLVGDIKAVDSGRGVPGVCPGLRLGSDPARLCPHCL